MTGFLTFSDHSCTNMYTQRFDIQRFTLGKKAPFFRSMRILTRSALDLRIPEDRHVLLCWFCMVIDHILLLEGGLAQALKHTHICITGSWYSQTWASSPPTSRS